MSTSSSKSIGKRQAKHGGKHMVDYVDTDSVDFEPLTKSINGAALTDLNDPYIANIESDQASPTKSGDFLYHKVRSTADDECGEEESDEESNDQTVKNKKYRKSDDWKICKRAFTNIIRSFIPQKVKNLYQDFPTQTLRIPHVHVLTSTELSMVSSFTICVVFFAIIVLSTFISNTLGGMSEAELSAVAIRSKTIDSHLVKGGTFSRQGVGLAPPVGTRIPPLLEKVFADVNDQPVELMDTAIFWQIPRSAGTTMKNVVTTCFGKVIATELGGADGHHLDKKLGIIKKPHGLFVNVDTTTIQGLRHAKAVGLVQSKMASVIFTPYIQDASNLFDVNHRGRFFTLLREPVERLVSLYYYRRIGEDFVRNQSLEAYAQSAGENWMVRMLTSSMSGPLEAIHLNTAKEILRSKFIIGLLDEKTESFRRFEEYFGWTFPSPVAQTCKNNMYYFEWHNKNIHPMPDDDDPAIERMRKLNKWDIELYEYAKQLFREQKALFWSQQNEPSIKWQQDSKKLSMENETSS